MDAITPKRRRPRQTPKGRQIDPRAAEEIATLLGARPRRRDLLIEFLHLIQDRYGHISAPHLAALAAEMKLAQAEVYEVATFYAHFDVVKDGSASGRHGAGLRLPVLRHGGRGKLLSQLPGNLGAGVRVLRAPCMGRAITLPWPPLATCR